TGLEADPVSASEIKIAVGPIDVFETGLSVDASFAMVNGTLEKDAYKEKGKFKFGEKKAFVIGANLNYGTTVGGAGLDLGYGVEFVMPRVEEGEADPNELTHSVTADYSFTDNLKLELGATIFHTLAEEPETAQKYTAGLTFKF